MKVGEKIDVEVIAVDHEKQRVSLSLKNLEPDPWIEAEKNIKTGDKVEGVISRIKHFGAFVEVCPGVEALLPHAEVVELQNKIGSVLKVGDKVLTYILKFNPTDKRIALTVDESKFDTELLKRNVQIQKSHLFRWLFYFIYLTLEKTSTFISSKVFVLK